MRVYAGVRVWAWKRVRVCVSLRVGKLLCQIQEVEGSPQSFEHAHMTSMRTKVWLDCDPGKKFVFLLGDVLIVSLQDMTMHLPSYSRVTHPRWN